MKTSNSLTAVHGEIKVGLNSKLALVNNLHSAVVATKTTGGELSSIFMISSESAGQEGRWTKEEVRGEAYNIKNKIVEYSQRPNTVLILK